MKSKENRYEVAMLEGRPGWYRCTDTESGVEMDFDVTDPNGHQDEGDALRLRFGYLLRIGASFAGKEP